MPREKVNPFAALSSFQLSLKGIKSCVEVVRNSCIKSLHQERSTWNVLRMFSKLESLACEREGKKMRTLKLRPDMSIWMRNVCFCLVHEHDNISFFNSLLPPIRGLQGGGYFPKEVESTFTWKTASWNDTSSFNLRIHFWGSLCLSWIIYSV